ncbi:HesA/MoeB/ThiF family protein [Rhodohalobacter sp. 8-1]|uniref:HesA/MoeB/ThiF family protein n=1 Tax=Rhodohalobacter sp. 8-1 TaxID=3131972 RepID=UPI0030EB4A07
MNSHELNDRYSRQERLPEVGIDGQKALSGARVLIVGMGGLGCPAAQYLAAAGVGSLGLMDHDTVNLSNLHRQILFRENDIGQPKAELAKQALQRINSEIEITAIPDWLTDENAVELFESHDLVIDGSDNFRTKYLINDASIMTDTPWIYASIYKFQGQISVFNYQNGPSYRCLFPTTTNRNVSCEEVGVMGPLPGVLGTMQASESIKMILNTGGVLSGKLKLIDLKTHKDQLIEIQRNDAEIKKVKHRGIKIEIFRCSLDSGNTFYLDVRDPFEEPQLDAMKVINIPMSRLDEKQSDIPDDQPVHVICQTGKRSRQAIEQLQTKYGFTNLVNVEGGIQAIMKKNKQETHA